VDYGGHAVNCNLALGEETLRPTDVAKMFGRPFMGGLERKGVIATGSLEAIRRTMERVLAETSKRFILAANCTIANMR
jgi:uroporphyrinogen decarboxylase